MRIGTAHKYYESIRIKGWHKWFAWYPVKVDYDTIVWLQFVERMATGMNYSTDIFSLTFDYRFLPFNE